MQFDTISKTTLKILIVNPYGIGDVLFTTPLLRTIEKTYPNSSISLLLGSRTQEIFVHNPHVNTIFMYKKDYFKTLPVFKRFIHIIKILLTIRKENFDVLIDLSNTDEYAFFAQFIWSIPMRIGFQYKNRGRFLTHKIKIPNGFKDKPVADYYISLLTFLNISPPPLEKKLDFYLNPKTEEEIWANTLFKKHHIKENDRCICILPGGGASWGGSSHQRYWPSSYFSDLSNLLIEKYNAKIFMIGSASEKKLCEEVIRSVKFLTIKHSVINLAGETTLHELAHLMKKSSLIIGIDSGPLHLAVALDCTCISIYGPISKISYGPYSTSGRQMVAYHDIPCRPCYKNFRMPTCENRLCLSELTPLKIFEKACFAIDHNLQKSILLPS